VSDDGLGGGAIGGMVRFGALLVAAAILGFGLLQREGNTDARWLLALAASGPCFTLLLWPSLPANLPTFNRTVVRLGTLLVVAFLLVSIHLVRLQVVRADELATMTRETDSGDIVANQRLLIDALRQQRGNIYDSTGKVLADTIVTPEGYAIRHYPSAVGSYVVGYYSPQLYGLAGIESQFDAYLTGQEGGNGFDTWQRNLLHQPVVGNNLTLTLDLRLQQVADDALAGRAGAVVAINPSTGAILANVSTPHFDPQQLVLDPRKDEAEEVARAKAYWAVLNYPNSNDPLLPRGTQGLYVPGSIFKTVTVSAALDDHVVSLDKVYPDPGDLVVDGHRIVELNRPEPVKNQYTVTEGYLYSLNVVFAQIGLDLGATRMREYTDKFGFGQEPPFLVPDRAKAPPVATSSVSSDPNYLLGKPALADTGFGQGELLVSPLHMALIASTVANGGKMPTPYLVETISSPNGHIIYDAKPQTWLTPIGSQTANQVRQLMISNVDRSDGGAFNIKINGLTIGGKTGTAEVGDGTTHAWFICFAGKPNQAPEIAIAVVVEHGGGGGTNALPIAKKVVEAYFAGR
jgi:peptidoglycan glycosyltransferase